MDPITESLTNTDAEDNSNPYGLVGPPQQSTNPYGLVGPPQQPNNPYNLVGPPRDDRQLNFDQDIQGMVRPRIEYGDNTPAAGPSTPQPGPIGAAIAGAAPAAAPITAAIGAGTWAAGAAAPLVGPITEGLGLAAGSIAAPWITIPAALGAGLIASGVVGKIQDWLRNNYGPSTGPLSKPYETAAAEQQPIAYNIGRAAPIAAGMTTGNVSPLVRAASAGLLGSVDVVQQGIEKGFGNIDPTEALIQAGAGAVLPQAREWAGGARPYMATKAPAVGEEGVTPSGTTAAPVPKTSAQDNETPVGKPAAPEALAEQQAQGQKSAPFNTSPSVATSFEQPRVPGASDKFDPAATTDARFGATVRGDGSEQDYGKSGVGLGAAAPRVDGAPTTVVDTAPIPADIAAAVEPTPVQAQQNAAPSGQTSAPAPSPSPQAAAIPSNQASMPTQPPIEPNVRPPIPTERPTPAQEATPVAPESQARPVTGHPDIDNVVQAATAAAAKRTVVDDGPMPSIANSSKADLNDLTAGQVVIDRQVAQDHPEFVPSLAVHETVEGALKALGVSDDVSHRIATGAERADVERRGLNWDEYSQYFKDISPQVEAQKVMPGAWDKYNLHIDPYDAIEHHTNKDIMGEFNAAEATPPGGEEPATSQVSTPAPGTSPESDFLRRQPPAAQEAIATSTGRPKPASLGAAAAGAPEGTGGMEGNKMPPPNAVKPNPHDPANPDADPAAQAYADSLYDKFNLMRSRLRNAYQSMRNYYMKAPKQTNEEWEQIGQAWTRHTEDQLPDNLKPAYEYFRDHIAPKQQTVAKEVYALNKKWNLFNMDDPNAESPTRFLSRQEINDEVVPRGEDVLTGQTMTGWDPSVAQRDFKLAIEAGPDGRYRPDGKSFLIKDNGDGTSLTRWDGKTPAKYDYERPGADPEDQEIKPLNVGDEIKIRGKNYMISHADAQHVEDQGIVNPLTGKPIEYNKNALTASMVSTEGLLRARDTMKLLDDIKTDPKYADNFIRGGSREAEAEAKEKWGGLYQTNLDQFKGTPGKPLYMSQATAQALNDFKKPGFNTPDWLTNAANALIKSLYVPGFPIHDLNVATQWFIGKPWNNSQAWRGLLEDFPTAYKDVMSQGDLQQEIRHANGSTQLFGVLDYAQRESIYRNAGQEMVKNSPFWQNIADKAGVNVPQLAQDVYNFSRRNMWKINDLLYTQQYMTFKRMGMSPEEAVKATERFIPNYRINNKVLGKRWLAQLYNTPGLSLFGPFHAGLWNSWQRVIGNAATGDPEERKAAIVSMIAMGVAGMFIKPYLMDPLARLATGNPNAEFGPRGMLTIPSQLAKIATGQQGYESAVPNLFTPSLPISAAMGGIRNLDWTGQPVIPRANLVNPLKAGRAVAQGADYLGKALVPPYSALASDVSEKGTTPGRVANKLVTSNLGIKNPSPASVNYMNQIEKNNARIQKEHRQGPLERVYNKLTGQ